MNLNKLNPLLLPNITSNVFTHFDESTLEKLRLVCQSWNQEACIALRQLKTIELTNMKSLKDYVTTFQPTFDIFGVFPHSKFRFAFRNEQLQLKTSTSSNPEAMLNDLLLNDFLDNFGKFITCCYIPMRSLHFDASFLDKVLCKLPNISLLGLHIQYFTLQNAPLQFCQNTTKNLQSVHSLIVQIEGLEVSEDSTSELLSFLFLYLPNLRRISYPGDIRRISKTGLFLRDVIIDSETSDNLKKLCSLEFKTRLLEEHCLKLLCKDFPINKLFIDLYNPEDDQKCVNSEIMGGLMRKYETLNHLEIEFPFRKDVSYNFNFPLVMEGMKILYLGGFEGCLLELLKKLPNLTELELSQCELLSILPKPDETNVNLNMKRLLLDFCMGQTAGVLSRFSRIFPHLQSLNINHTTNEVARVIFQKMQHLSKLTIQGDDLTDAGMCGFSEYTLKEKDFLRISQTEGSKLRKYSYIADLRELRYLNLDAFALTEITVRHGLVHCHSLRLVKMDCTAGGGDASTTVSRKFRLSEYENHMVEEGHQEAKTMTVEMKEEPPMEEEALAFFKSHDKFSDDLPNC